MNIVKLRWITITGFRDNLVYFNPDTQASHNKKMYFLTSLCIHSDSNFREYDKSKMLNWLQFSDEVKNLDIYKKLEDKQGTYDIAHLRRDDILERKL